MSLWSAPGEGVLVHPPAYDAFGNMLAANDRVLLPARLKRSGELPDRLGLLRAASRSPRLPHPAALQPHNPTGRVWTRDELGRMAAICQRHGVKVISDDIHMDVSFARYLPWSEVAEDESWALVSSGSKSFNIPALGGAYAFIANAETRAGYLQRLKTAHGLIAPILGVLAHISAYRDGGAWLDALKSYLHGNLTQVAARLNAAFPAIGYRVPEGPISPGLICVALASTPPNGWMRCKPCWWKNTGLPSCAATPTARKAQAIFASTLAARARK